MIASQINPVIVRVVEAPTPETNVADVLMGAVGMVGFILIASLLLGLVAGGLFIGFRKLKARLSGEAEFPLIEASPLTHVPPTPPPQQTVAAPR